LAERQSAGTDDISVMTSAVRLAFADNAAGVVAAVGLKELMEDSSYGRVSAGCLHLSFVFG